MRRYFLMMFFLLLLISCRAITFPIFHPKYTATQPSFSPSSTPNPPSQSATISPSVTPGSISLTLTPLSSATFTPATGLFRVLYHPDDALYVGDQVSFEVVSPPGVDIRDATLHVQVDPPDGPKFDAAKFSPWGIQGRDEATLLWVWDTKNSNPGSHTISYSVQPQGNSWTEQVTLLPSNAMPADQADAHWAETKTTCCIIFYITDTASERDLSTLSAMVDAQAQDAIQKMGANFTEPITITILPRLLGHGGFTSDEISVSYLDRNYASDSFALVVHHEMIHAIDGHLGGDFRPTIFVEGLAVYMTGGHYEPEPLMPRAAALLDESVNLYIPLKSLADDFYASQHEVGYLEGASLIEYMIKTYGEQAFFSFYRDIHNKQGESQSDSIDAALKVHFSIPFSALEQDFITALRSETDSTAWVDDVRLTVTFYNTMRRYQLLLDPSAYFRTAWLLDNKTMRQRGIVGDYLRHPRTLENITLETLFLTAGQQLSTKNYLAANQTLEQINTVLDNIERGTNDPFSVSTSTSDYLSIATALVLQGYEAQNISISGENARVEATTSSGPNLIVINMTRSGGQWMALP